jgi:hypothetical protein
VEGSNFAVTVRAIVIEGVMQVLLAPGVHPDHLTIAPALGVAWSITCEPAATLSTQSPDAVVPFVEHERPAAPPASATLPARGPLTCTVSGNVSATKLAVTVRGCVIAVMLQIELAVPLVVSQPSH